MPFLRKYGTGTGADVIIPIIKRGVVDFAVTADWTPASGDVKVSKDGGTEANIGTLPVINGTVGWKFVFSDAELQCKSLTVRVVDSATKAVEDQFFVVETYGHASAMFVVDFSTAAFGAVMPTTAGRTLAVSAAGAVELDSAATAALVDLIWDEPLTGATHNVATSSGKRLRQSTAFQQIDSTVIDASATTTTFITGLTSAVDDFFNDSMLVFTDGALAGQVRAIYDYIGATKTIILEEALTSAPVNGVAFSIVSLHIHPVSQIQSGLATAASIVTLRGADSDTLKTLSDQIDTVSTNVSSIASVSREAF
jgi:hypothetical protein